MCSVDKAEEQLVVGGLLAFVDREIVPLEEELGETLHDPRLHYGNDGREAAAVTQARRATRMAAARAGYYTMFCPPDIGGGD